MMDAMPRPRPLYLRREINRHGKTVWYIRKAQGGERVRLRAEYGTPEFWTEYRAAIEGIAKPQPGREASGTLAWLIARYRETTAWAALSALTKRQREAIFRQTIETAGTVTAAQIGHETILAGRERRVTTPNQARHFLDAMRGLFRWANGAGIVKRDPTEGVSNPQRSKGVGFRPWNEDDVAAYEACWPLGTRQRVWLDVLIYTGLRRGDAVRLGRQHVRDGIATLTTEKGSRGIAVTLPILPILAATLKAGPIGELAFIVGANGRPMTKGTFGNQFVEAAAAAGVRGSAHGVRKIAATRAANAGATVAQLEAIFGWSGGGMASLYTRAADRRRLSTEAMHKLGKAAPQGKVRLSTRK